MMIRCLMTCAVAIAAASGVAHGDELPLRKAGLWELKMGAQPPMPAVTMQQCTDETTDRAMTSAVSPVASETCTRNEVTKTATGYTTLSACTVAGKQSTTRADITGDFDSAYTVKVTPQASGTTRSETMTIEAKWVGACKADQKPGDVLMPGGMKVNVNDLAAARDRRR